MEPERLKAIIEAALLASPKPLRTAQLAELFDAGQRPEPDAIGKALHSLAEDCQGRGIELVEVGSGFRYQVRTEVFPHLDALWTERPSRYSRALLETLALMAYRQPITRGEIEQIRGVSVATSILRTLEERDWVRVVGHRDVPGKPALYGTTKAFLDYFSLRSLDELPPLSALRDLDALEPQLDLDGSNNHDPAAVAATTSAAASAQGPDNTDGDDQGAAGAGNGKSPASDAGGQPDTVVQLHRAEMAGKKAGWVSLCICASGSPVLLYSEAAQVVPLQKHRAGPAEGFEGCSVDNDCGLLIRRDLLRNNLWAGRNLRADRRFGGCRCLRRRPCRGATSQ